MRQDVNWFLHRFRNTMAVDDDGNVYRIEDYVDGEDFLLYLVEGSRTEEVVADWHELSKMKCGMPKHGWVNNSKGHGYYIPQMMYDNWKWGWRPDRDTDHREWRLLLTPKHAGLSAYNSCPDTITALNYDFAVEGEDFHFNNDIVGLVKDDKLLLYQEYAHLMHDQLLDIPKEVTCEQ